MSGNEFAGFPGLDEALVSTIVEVFDRLDLHDFDATDYGVRRGPLTTSALAGVETRKLMQLLEKLYVLSDYVAFDETSRRFTTPIDYYAGDTGRRPLYTSRFSNQDIAERSG